MNALTRYGLVVAIVLQLLVYGWIARLSSAFEFHASATDRPIVLVLSLLAINFGLHLVSLFLFTTWRTLEWGSRWLLDLPRAVWSEADTR